MPPRTSAIGHSAIWRAVATASSSLLDIGLPGMDGYQVARRLREKPEFKTVMICALTGFTPSEADRQRQQQTGFDHHFVKPVELETLLELFKDVVQQHDF